MNVDEYIAEVPRAGVEVRIHMDGGKPGNVERYVLTRDLGRWGLARLDGRFLVVDRADLDELYDEAIEAHGDLVDADGRVKANGPQISLDAIVRAIGRCLFSSSAPSRR